MQIPFHKPYITEDEVSEVLDTVRSGWLTMGPRTLQFEQEFSKYVGSPHAVAVNSGTSALHLALKAIDLKPGDEVIVPTMTFTATAEVVCYFNATPILVDIERDTHNMDVSLIEKTITPRTRAIIPVHYGGQPCDMDAIMEIARSRGLYVIEDAAHSLPAWYGEKSVGTIGDLTCFSFYATKPLAAGEGGMVTTENGDWAERIRVLRLHGISKDAWKRYSAGGSWYYEVTEVGYKYNMTDVQAALALSQLRKLDFMWERRKYITKMYSEGFSGSEAITTPTFRPDRVSSFHLYPIKINPDALTIDRAQFIEELGKRSIGTSVHFIPLHRHPFYRNRFSYDEKDFPEAEWVYERLISLPVYPGMSNREIEYVINSVNDISTKHKK
ncbi:MAG: spore coat protein [Thermodesulfobacteriota bacterium]|nr:MAG: spore coat protein [Thermodesulfobacteriota bacterium]